VLWLFLPEEVLTVAAVEEEGEAVRSALRAPGLRPVRRRGGLCIAYVFDQVPSPEESRPISHNI
jgi:hypothetical protein